LPFAQQHAKERTLGFRFGDLAYSCDVSGIPEESLPALARLDVWILDALRYRPHPSHFSLEEALAWIARLKPRRAILTNLHTDLDYETLRKSLPESVEPGYDGLKIVL
jgi:phosphoribosyl 1,2-cyclic phosphate phosphodiesterase